MTWLFPNSFFDRGFPLERLWLGCLNSFFDQLFVNSFFDRLFNSFFGLNVSSDLDVCDMS